MLGKIKDWLGFGDIDDFTGHAGNHGHAENGDHGLDGHSHHGHGGGHGHTHGVIDPSVAATERGVWAVKWSFVILALTAALQLVVVLLSNSVALLADMIHNVGDATTAIPLWIAFVLARRKPSKRFTYGLGRVEDLAGLMVVAIILFSAMVAGYEAIDRLIHPHHVVQLGWLAAAGFIGFLGNEIVAVFRIRVGRQLNSAALVADGYHARTDGLTSLAVVLGAFGVWMGYPLADPIIGLLITITIFGIVWQSARAVITRTLDGVDPDITDEARHAASHVAGVRSVNDVKARWIGHELSVDLTISVDPTMSVVQAEGLADQVKHELGDHIPPLTRATVTFGGESAPSAQPKHRHDHDDTHVH
jgi:cation diffusion facilitator family transporter